MKNILFKQFSKLKMFTLIFIITINSMNAQSTGNVELIMPFGDKDVAYIVDNNTNCIYKTSPYSKGILKNNQSVSIFSINSQENTIYEVKSLTTSFSENIYSTSHCSNKMTTNEIDEYFSQAIFDSFEESNLEIFQKLKTSELKTSTIDGKKIIYSTFEDFYFIDNSDIILLGKGNKDNKQITLFDFNNQIKTFVKYNTNTNGDIILDENSLTFTEFSNSPLTKAAPCKDYIGFSLCYTAVLAGTVVSGPTVVGAAAVWLTGTAYCYYAECVK